MFSKNTEIADSASPIPSKYSINLMYIQRADNDSLPMITDNAEARFGMDSIVQMSLLVRITPAKTAQTPLTNALQ